MNHFIEKLIKILKPLLRHFTFSSRSLVAKSSTSEGKKSVNEPASIPSVQEAQPVDPSGVTKNAKTSANEIYKEDEITTPKMTGAPSETDSLDQAADDELMFDHCQDHGKDSDSLISNSIDEHTELLTTAIQDEESAVTQGIDNTNQICDASEATLDKNQKEAKDRNEVSDLLSPVEDLDETSGRPESKVDSVDLIDSSSHFTKHVSSKTDDSQCNEVDPPDVEITDPSTAEMDPRNLSKVHFELNRDREEYDSSHSCTGSSANQQLTTSEDKYDKHAEKQTQHESDRVASSEDENEYEVVLQDVSIMFQEYARWNSIIIEQLLLAQSSSEHIYLCVNPRKIAWIYAEAGNGILTPDQAEERFSASVAEVYNKRVLAHRDHLRILRRCGSNGFPECVAFLVLSVLAAYHMQSDEELSGRAYYRRLARLLACGMTGAHPEGFSPQVFKSLWGFTRDWFKSKYGRHLMMPGPDVGIQQYIALPLAHVPLRSLDIDKLPAFFTWAAYESGSQIRGDRLLEDLRQWQNTKNVLTQTGTATLFDNRCNAVLAQVNAELESWDGSYHESISRHSALVKIQFDVIQRLPVLSFLPKRPPGFPAIFDDGVHIFEASDEDWYDPQQILSADGESLAKGFEWRSHVNNTQFTLRRPETLAIALTPSTKLSYSGYLSSSRLLRGVKCSVLCHESVAKAVHEYLREVAQQSLNTVEHPSLPNGWRLIHNVTARTYIEAPSGLDSLQIDTDHEVIFSGGLREGRQKSWIAGAPPRVFVSGLESGDIVRVNGQAVGVNEGGELLVNEMLVQQGEYVIEAGRVQRRIQILNPKVLANDIVEDEFGAGIGTMTALPRGSWTLIGSSSFQVSRSRHEFSRGTLVPCSFHPIWAIQSGGGPGAKVVVLTKPEPPQKYRRRKIRVLSSDVRLQWADAIYNANIRRPEFWGLHGTVPDNNTKSVWKMYVAVAKQIKHATKN